MNAPEEKYMRRALQLARYGRPWAVPNPFVGAVIVSEDGRIIGEGYHRRCGEAHAEVNAVRSVSDPPLLRGSTMYVTLEPCAHYGRTGPCAKLIIDCGIPRVVVGTRDPFPAVDGKGIEMLREAGVEVIVGMLEKECRYVNAMFFTAHTRHRPFVMLKWAQSADNYMDTARTAEEPAAQISTPLTRMMMHRLRTLCGGIIVGSTTVLMDDPSLDNRFWPGPTPRPIVLDRRGRVPASAAIMARDPLIIHDDKPLAAILEDIYRTGIISVMVEGGPSLLRSFISEGIWDVARIETAPERFGEYGRAKAPSLPDCMPLKIYEVEGRIIRYYSNNPYIDARYVES